MSSIVYKKSADMKKIVFSLIIVLNCISVFSQVEEKNIPKEVIALDSIKGTWDINVDLASRYIWRGQSWGGDYPVLQLYGNYNVSEKFSLGFCLRFCWLLRKASMAALRLTSFSIVPKFPKAFLRIILIKSC